MSGQEINVVTLIQALSIVQDESVRFLSEPGDLPLPGSPAALEQGKFAKPDDFKTVYAQAIILIDVTADHMTALVKMLDTPRIRFGPWSCVRAMMECGAIASWLLEPAIGGPKRVARSLALRIHELKEQQGLARSDGKEKLAIELEKRIENVQKEKNNFPRAQMPNKTNLIRDYLQAETDYHLMSAVVHGYNWALIQTGFQFDKTKGFGSPIVGVELNPKIAWYLCNKATSAFLHPVWLWCEFLGIDQRPLEAKVETSLAILGTRISKR